MMNSLDDLLRDSTAAEAEEPFQSYLRFLTPVEQTWPSQFPENDGAWNDLLEEVRRTRRLT
jgi:hypothetical protein